MDKELLNIMDHLDGIAQEKPSTEVLEEVQELKEIADILRILPVEDTELHIDEKFSAFLETQKTKKRFSGFTSGAWPYLILAASLALLVYLFLPSKLSEQYDALYTNTEKVGFIYELNEVDLDEEEYLWLVSLLESEECPNIRVTLIDLIEQQQEHLPSSIAQLLTKEQIPAVQMALLNTIDLKYTPDMKGHLMVFNDREDLDKMVRQRLADILNQNN